MSTFFSNFKKIVQPLQLWLLGQGRCVGCGKNLVAPENVNKETQVTCSCGRIYMYNPEKKKFRRALVNEVRL